MEAPRTAMDNPMTHAQARRVADALQKALDDGWAYMPPHKHPAIKARIAELRAWARLGEN